MSIVLRSIVVFLAFAGAAHAGVISVVRPWTVGNGLECEFGTVQAALNAAAAATGAQTIQVTRSASYTAQAIVISDAAAVTLAGGYDLCVSTSASGTTALVGSSASSVIRIAGAGDVTVRDLDISGGGGTFPAGSTQRHGGGIQHAGSGLLTVETSRVHGNNGGYGSGIAVLGSASLSVSMSEIIANATGRGGIYAATTGSVRIAGSLIEGNAASGVHVLEAASLEIDDGSIVHNDAALAGPALQLLGSGPVRLRDLLIEGDAGGGLQHAGSGTLELDGVTLRGNGTPENQTCSAQAGGLHLTGSGAVQVRDSLLEDNCGALAGGILFDDGTLLQIERTRIVDNRSYDNGGGLHARGTDPAEMPVVRFGVQVLVERNIAQNVGHSNGGGIYAAGVDLDLRDAPGHRIADNSADGNGGGIAIVGGRARIGSGAADGNIVENMANASGGGLSVGGDAEVQLYTTYAGAPVALRGNRTGPQGLGGGMRVVEDGGAPRVYAWDLNIEDNVAGSGGGVLIAGGHQDAVVVCLGRVHAPGSCADLGGALPPDAERCAPGLPCNTIRGNRGEVVFGGAALMRYSTGSVPIHVRLVGARVLGNIGRSVFTSTPGAPVAPAPNGALELIDSVVAGNTATSALFEGAPAGYADFPPDTAFALGPVSIERSTIAGNAIGGAYVIGTRLGLSLIESIVYQPYVAVHAGNGAGVFARHVIVSDMVGMPVRIDVVAADPLLVDAEDGDVQLQPGSPAIDFSNHASGGRDIEGIPRGQQAPGVADRFGPRDLGAHEVGLPVLFGDDFESSSVAG